MEAEKVKKKRTRKRDGKAAIPTENIGGGSKKE